MPKDLHDLCVARERISRLGGGGSEKGDDIARVHLRAITPPPSRFLN
jgi:hypothetical protein